MFKTPFEKLTDYADSLNVVTQKGCFGRFSNSGVKLIFSKVPFITAHFLSVDEAETFLNMYKQLKGL